MASGGFRCNCSITAGKLLDRSPQVTQNRSSYPGLPAFIEQLRFDRHSLIADPRFVNPEKGDFHLTPESPAFKLGFQAIPIERIGPEGFRKES